MIKNKVIVFVLWIFDCTIQVERAHLDGLSLVRSCIQKAVGLLRDPDDLTSRGMQRMHILLMYMSSAENPAAGTFLHDLFCHVDCRYKWSGGLLLWNWYSCLSDQTLLLTAARFQSVLLSQLAEALAHREEMMPAPKEWVSKEAKKRQALQEGGTLR